MSVLHRSSDFKETPKHEDIEPKAALAWDSVGEANVESYTAKRCNSTHVTRLGNVDDLCRKRLRVRDILDYSDLPHRGFECGNDPTVISLSMGSNVVTFNESSSMLVVGQFAPYLSGYSRRMVDVHSLQSDTPDLGDSSHSTVQFPAHAGSSFLQFAVGPSATPTIRSLREEDGYSGKLTYWTESLTLAHPQLWRRVPGANYVVADGPLADIIFHFGPVTSNTNHSHL
ncbi:hypothetical protein EV421DRAFT_1734888 [Armillaria borealis]|uniref:Uncharacterized protein n=1 Tax=Armillaria borealis TaxID=47425 RepID=A0AA39JMV8_9AGAR|nr:hypothetical protein EV421DRAFT_1734888 [Armillaria borealis]